MRHGRSGPALTGLAGIAPRRAALALAGALALSACISLGPDVPETLIGLTAERSAAPGTLGGGELAEAIIVFEPQAPQRLDVTRVPVQVDEARIAYLKDAIWVEKPARLFQKLLAETIRAGGRRLVLDSPDPGIPSGTRLFGRLVDMGYDARTSEVVVRYDAIRESPGGEIETRRFESRVGGVAADAGAVAPALNTAANAVARDVAAWIG